MKVFEKKDCQYKDGYIVSGNEVVAVDNEVVDLLNHLDLDIQKFRFNEEHAVDPIEIPEFKPQSEHRPKVTVSAMETPTLDKVTEMAMDLMKELDSVSGAEMATRYFDSILPVVKFVINDTIISHDSQFKQFQFDLPTIGNPLELTEEKLADLICEMFTPKLED